MLHLIQVLKSELWHLFLSLFSFMMNTSLLLQENNTCIICNQGFDDPKSKVISKAKGILGINQASKKRGDTLFAKEGKFNAVHIKSTSPGVFGVSPKT